MNHPAAARIAEVVPNDHVPNYQVHLNGVLPGHDAHVVAAVLAPRFKRSEEQLAAILNGPMMVLKRDIDRQTAEQYVTVLTKAGCACSMHQQTVAPAPVPVRLVKPAPAAEQPMAPSQPVGQQESDLAMAAIGQTLCIDAIIYSFVFAKILREAPAMTQLLGYLAISVLSVLGATRIINGLHMSNGMRVLNTVAAMIPVASLISLCILSSKVTRRLREAGFKVGLLGVSAAERAMIADAQGAAPHSRMPSIATLIVMVLICSAAPGSLK